MFKSLKSVLGSFNLEGGARKQKSSTSNPQALFFELIKIWPEIVGEKLAGHSIPLKNTNKILTILTDHPSWAQELSFLEQQIKVKIRKRLPFLSKEITRIKFQADNQFFKNRLKTPQPTTDKIKPNKKKEKRPPLHHFSPEYLKYKSEADQMFKDVDDNETKDLLTSIFINYKHSNNKSIR